MVTKFSVEHAMDALDDIRGRAVPDELLFTYIADAVRASEHRYSCLDSDFVDVEQRIALLLEAISLKGIPDDRRDQALISLAEAYYLRGVHRSQSDNFSKSIDLLAIFLDSSVDRDLAFNDRVLLLAGSALRQRYISLGDGQDLARAFKFHSILTSDDEKTGALGILALTELSRTFFEQGRFTSDLALIDSSIQLVRRALDACNVDSIYQHIPYMLYGRSSMFRCIYTGDFSPADEMISFGRRGIALAPHGHRDYYEAAAGLGVCLYIKAWQCGDMGALDECIRVLNIVLPTHGQYDGRAMAPITNSANALEMKFRRDGQIQDLDEAISRLKSYIATIPAGVIARPELLTSLSNTLLSRYVATGDAQSIDEAAEAQLTVLATSDSNNKRRSDWLSHLAACRFGQYKNSGDISNLEDAVAVAEQGFGMQMGKRGSAWEIQIATLIEYALELYQVGPRPHILERVTTLAQAWLRNRSLEELNAGSYLTIVAVVFRVRFEQFKMVEDLTTGIGLLEEALVVFESRKDLEYISIALLEYGRALQCRYERDAADVDARQAFRHRLEALKLLTLGHPRRALGLMEVARSELCVESPTFSPQEGIDHLLEALSLSHTSAHTRLSEGTRVLRSLEKSISRIQEKAPTISFLDVYRRAINLMPQVASLGLSADARLRILVKASGLISRGWSHAVFQGDVKAALEILEIGRGVFWAQCLRLRTKFDLLPPDMAKRLTTIANALEVRMPESVGDDEGRAATNREVARRRGLSEEFEQLLITARSLPGFEDLLAVPRYDDLAKAAIPFPVVVLVPGEQVSHALIMLPEEEPYLLELPCMTVKRAEELASHLSQLIAAPRHNTRDLHAPQRSFRIVGSSEVVQIDVYLESWLHVMLPVISYLGLKKRVGRHRPRIMLCPTGVFMRLPLHASGDHSTPEGACVSDFAVPSYTPTISALLNARREFVPVTREEAEVLLAAVPEPFAGSPLPYTKEEALAVRSTVPEGALRTTSSKTLVGEVLEALPSSSIVHLACHGIQDPRDALQSGFVMEDGLLTISKLMELNLPNAFLAVLSACETAKGDLTQPDQAIHLAGTMLFAGFRSVVATMWSMGDLDGPVIAKSLYEGIFSGGETHLKPDDVPYALDAAVSELRQAGLHPSFWATYVHIGI